MVPQRTPGKNHTVKMGRWMEGGKED
jgi:hypothetical protein